MKHNTNCLILITLLSCSVWTNAHSQATPTPTPTPSADTARPNPVAINAGFDVIIKKNGDLLYGLVKEVGATLIRYQRTDIPEGPIYTVSRDEVYAISYRNQVKDIINPKENTIVHDTVIIHDSSTMSQPAPNSSGQPAVSQPSVSQPSNQPPPKNNMHAFPHSQFFRAGNLRIGLGFLRSFTRVDQVSLYSSSVSFPIISLGYDVRYNQQLRLGAQIAFGPHHFSNQVYDSYDGTQTNTTLHETIFMLDLYGKYSFAYHTDKLQPYILAGIGIHSSHTNSSYNINFVNNQDNALLIKSGSNSVGLGIIGRIGTEYKLNNTTRAFGDIGFGASIINLGISLNVY